MSDDDFEGGRAEPTWVDRAVQTTEVLDTLQTQAHEILSQQTRKNENVVTRTALNAATKPIYL